VKKLVIVAIPSKGKGGMNDEMSPRFGRCTSFTFVELEAKEIVAVKAVPNHAFDAMGGAGVQATQIVGNNGAEVAIVGFLGPNAANGLRALNIKTLHYSSEKMGIKEVINCYIEGKLEEMSSPNVASHYGAGAGQNRQGIHNS
jgi:predicted Fe-Mo cluster-binding NifX family protein